MVQINGFTSGALFDSSDEYNLAFPDLDREVGDGAGGFGNVTADLSLSLKWNQDLTQQESPIGPEISPEDVLPGLEGPVNARIRLVCRLSLDIKYWRGHHS